MNPVINMLGRKIAPSVLAVALAISPSHSVIASGRPQQPAQRRPSGRARAIVREPARGRAQLPGAAQAAAAFRQGGVDVGNAARLSLEEAIRLAMLNNNDIDSSRLDVQMADYELRAARGIYDPRLLSELFYERVTQPVASLFGGGPDGKLTQKSVAGNAQVGGFVPWAGGSYNLTFNSSRLETNNQFATLNPQFPSSFNLSFTQPLIRGLKIDENRRRIEVAKRNLSLTDAQFRQRVIDTVSRVEQSYWDLVFASGTGRCRSKPSSRQGPRLKATAGWSSKACLRRLTLWPPRRRSQTSSRTSIPRRNP